MLANRKLALFLFASLGLNIFLGSVLGGTMLRLRQEPTAPATSETRVEASAPEKFAERDMFPLKSEKQTEHDRRSRPHKRKADGSHWGPGETPSPEGPSDLLLLRRMIQIMGGPKDPRIAQLREERREEMHRVRSDMHTAHKRVHEALTAEQPNEEDLHNALKNLRKTAFESQARAQEGILTLSKLMTPKEREKLRALRLGDVLGEGRSGKERGKERKQAPPEEKRLPAASP